MDGALWHAGMLYKNRLQSPSMDFALRANLRLFKFVPDEFVRIAASQRPE
jgi:hypothetical protein